MAVEAAQALSVMRALVGAGTWASPALSFRTFGLGKAELSPSVEVVGRLFGVRDLALGVSLQHPNAAVRRAALQLGVAVDSVDVVASAISLRRGAPKASGLGVGAGAAAFAALGLVALRAARP